MSAYYVYILHCADLTFYTGICTNLDRRVAEHNGSAKGAAYTKSRRPVELVYFEEVSDRSSALKKEHMLRKLSHQEKKSLAGL